MPTFIRFEPLPRQLTLYCQRMDVLTAFLLVFRLNQASGGTKMADYLYLLHVFYKATERRALNQLLLFHSWWWW